MLGDRTYRCGLTLLVASVVVIAGCQGEILVDGPEGKQPPGSQPPGGETEGTFVPAPLAMRSLLGWQYQQAVTDLLGTQAGEAVAAPPDSAINGFDAIGAAQQVIPLSSLTTYESSAFLAAQTALEDSSMRATLVECEPSSATDEACYRNIIEAFGRRAWRRPLAEEEIATWVEVGEEAGAEYGDFYKGVEFVVAGLLQSPNFLYLIEVGTPDPDDPNRLRLTDYELASRMSFFLTGSIPDEELLKAAEAGELHTLEQIRTHAARLLEKPQSKEALARFFDEHLGLRDLPEAAKDQEMFPDFDRQLAEAMREETQLFLADLVWEGDKDFRDAFDADYTFVNADLARHYGLDSRPASGFERVQLPSENGRAGLLGQASFLSLASNPTATSPTLRGKFVRQRLLCESIPDPPDDVIASFPDPEPGEAPKTIRNRVEELLENPKCEFCHKLMDPIGLGLENFDAVGRFQTEDNGLEIDPTGELDTFGQFVGPKALGQLLRQDERALFCLTRNLFRMATGHVDTNGEQVALAQANSAFQASGYRMKELLMEIVTNDAFRYARKGDTQ